jgi:hypothetical protein
LSGSVSFGAADQALTDRFKQEAPKQWQEYERISSALQGVCKLTIDAGDGQPSKSSVDYKFNEHCKLLLAQAGPSVPTKVFAYNPKYSFVLSRGSQVSPWVLEELKMAHEGPSPTVDQEISSAVQLNSILVFPHYGMLSELIRQPNFSVRNASLIRKDGDELVQIEFDNSHPLEADPKKFFPVQGGTLVLDPSRYWSVRSGILRSAYRATNVTSTVTTEADESRKGYPIPKKYVEQREMSAPGQSVTKTLNHVREFELHESDTSPPDVEFTLSAFGMAEPPGVEWKKPVPWFVWFGGAAIVLFVLAIGASWVKRQVFQRPQQGSK